MTERWVTVWVGSPGEADLIGSMLEAEDIPVYIPGPMAKVIDYQLAVEVQVPESAAQAAQERIEVRAEEDEDASSDEEDLENLARRIRWSAVLGLMMLTVPWVYTVVLGIFYFAALRKTGHRPVEHGLTLFAFWVAVLGLAAIAAAFIVFVF